MLGCLSQDLRYKEIADNPGISYQTVRTYIGRICETLKVRTRTGVRRQAPRALVEGAGTFIAFRIHPSSSLAARYVPRVTCGTAGRSVSITASGTRNPCSKLGKKRDGGL